MALSFRLFSLGTGMASRCGRSDGGEDEEGRQHASPNHPLDVLPPSLSLPPLLTYFGFHLRTDIREFFSFKKAKKPLSTTLVFFLHRESQIFISQPGPRAEQSPEGRRERKEGEVV
jgi:hypothetical protein